MKIVKVDDECIMFEYGSTISFDHEQNWCEYNYAWFQALDDIALQTDFNLEEIKFELVQDFGFRFGNVPNKMFFVPCYSHNNGYYSTDLSIFFNGKCVLEITDCPIEE